MKLKALTSIGIMLILCFFTSNLFAQITISNNLGIFPGPFPFTGTGKFTSIGESGGFVGPTDDGCDFYGFRAQTSLGNNVNMGIRIVDDGNPLTRTVRTPTILWGDNKRLEFLIKGTPNGQSGGANLTCGKRIAYLYDSPSNDFVLTLYGSGRAIGGIWQASDRKLKQNIKEIPNALNLVRQLNGVSYDYLNDQFADLNLPKTQQYGFIAQDVERILPSAVRDAGTDEFQKNRL